MIDCGGSISQAGRELPPPQAGRWEPRYSAGGAGSGWTEGAAAAASGRGKLCSSTGGGGSRGGQRGRRSCHTHLLRWGKTLLLSRMSQRQAGGRELPPLLPQAEGSPATQRCEVEEGE